MVFHASCLCGAFRKGEILHAQSRNVSLSFGDDPNVEACDNYDQTFLYQAYSKDVEAEVVEQASASFTEGKKLVYAEVQPIEELMDASYAYVLDFAGRHRIRWTGRTHRANLSRLSLAQTTATGSVTT